LNGGLRAETLTPEIPAARCSRPWVLWVQTIDALSNVNATTLLDVSSLPGNPYP
jgi:hypothetical protein